MRPPLPTPTRAWVATAAPRTVVPFDVRGRAVPAAQERSGIPLALAPTGLGLTRTARAPTGTGPPRTATEVPLDPTGRPVVRLSHTRRGATACRPSASAAGVDATQPTRSTRTSTVAPPLVTTTAPSAPGRAV